MKKGKKIIGLLGSCLFFFMLTSLVLMSQSLQNSALFGQYYYFLLVFNALGLLILITLILVNVKRLIRELKNHVIGSRMTIRMIIIFSFLSVTPVLVVYYFSLDFLHRGIDSWFDLNVDQALEDSLELSRLALDVRMRELLNTTEQVAAELNNATEFTITSDIDQIRNRINATELTLLTRQGTIIASSTSDTGTLFPNTPDEVILLQLLQRDSYITLDIVKDLGLLIRAVANTPYPGIGGQPLIIQALFSISERMNELTSDVQSAYIKYKELFYLREQLKISFIIILTLVLLFTIFSAIWTAFYSAKSLAAPIKNLAAGTQSIAKGNYDTQLPIPSNDELGFLVASFNDMAEKISTARDSVKKSQQEAESQRTYLETILARLSSGVMVVDSEGIVKKANISATEILGVNISEYETEHIQSLTNKYPKLAPFLACIMTHIKDQREWRKQITINDKTGDRTLIISGTVLDDNDKLSGNNIIVFDEVTTLIKAQRDAAWSEIARHLAHEIKNPLTPIQLAAEHLRYKYRNTMGSAEADMLNRMTNTIIQQVDTMKAMINSFSDYARTPEFTPKQINIGTLLKELVDLFSNIDYSKKVILHIAPGLPKIIGDEKKLRQVFNNILTNAVAANTITGNKQLTVSANQLDAEKMIEIRIIDQGPGIQHHSASKLFEPYVTTKKKGTGLGLAIVKKTINEHKGQVWLENNSNQPGCCAVIRLPIT